jgi:hypothetical protein
MKPKRPAKQKPVEMKSIPVYMFKPGDQVLLGFLTGAKLDADTDSFVIRVSQSEEPFPGGIVNGVRLLAELRAGREFRKIPPTTRS